MLTDNVADVAETDEEIDALVERLRVHFKMECRGKDRAKVLRAYAARQRRDS
jgi:hypothetical protein